MAFRRILGASSTRSLNIPSQFVSTRLNSTVAPITSRKLFVSGLSRNTTDENLQNAFAPFGKLREAKVMTDRKSGRSKGYAFVTYETVKEASNAREKMNAKFLDGWVIFVDPARPKELAPGQDFRSNNQTGFTSNKTVGWCG